MTEIHYQCGHACGQQLNLDVVLPPYEDGQNYANVLAGEVRAAGWVVVEVEVDNDGHGHVRAHCSVDCHNKRAREWFESRNSRRWRWWNKSHGFDGDTPPCTCRLLADDEGLLREVRAEDCPWCDWFDRWQRDRNDLQARLYEQWLDVPIGTLVEERENVNRSRGRGRTTGPAKIVTRSFGKTRTAMIPVEDWGPHPRLEDLTIVEDDERKEPT